MPTFECHYQEFQQRKRESLEKKYTEQGFWGHLIICFKERDHCSEFTVDVCTQIWARKTNVLPLMSTYKVTGLAFQEDSVGLICVSVVSVLREILVNNV